MLFRLGAVSAFVGGGNTPDGDATAESVIAPYTANRTQGIIAAIILALAAVPTLAFTATQKRTGLRGGARYVYVWPRVASMPRVNSSGRGLAGSIAGLKRSGNCAPTSLASGGLERIPAPRLGDASRKVSEQSGVPRPDIADSSTTGDSRFSARASRAVYPVRAGVLRRAGSTRMAGRRSRGTGGRPTSGNSLSMGVRGGQNFASEHVHHGAATPLPAQHRQRRRWRISSATYRTVGYAYWRVSYTVQASTPFAALAEVQPFLLADLPSPCRGSGWAVQESLGHPASRSCPEPSAAHETNARERSLRGHTRTPTVS